MLLLLLLSFRQLKSADAMSSFVFIDPISEIIPDPDFPAINPQGNFKFYNFFVK